MPAILRPVLARLIASVVAALAAWLNTKYGYTLDAETRDGIVAVMLGVFGVVYAVVHRLLDAKLGLNPHDSASPALAERSAEPSPS